MDVSFDVVYPTADETAPPLDEGMPPLLVGTVEITGEGGWQASGTFSAPLCTPLDFSFACE